MDGCSLADAFPSGASASAGCGDTRTAEESRRQEKKRARKCRGPALSYLNSGMNNVGAVDPDRQTAKLEPVPELNIHEPFTGSMDSLPAIMSNAKDANSLQGGNSFFGADPADDSCSNGSKKSSLIAPFVDIIGDDDSYRLEPDFSKSFKMRGTNKATSVPSPDPQQESYITPTKMLPSGNLPYPNTDMFWKENGLAGGQSSFFAHLKSPGGEPTSSIPEEPHAKSQEVLHKLDKIFARLDNIESAKSENSQTEVLLFILTGLGVIFLMDIGCRAASMRR